MHYIIKLQQLLPLPLLQQIITLIADQIVGNRRTGWGGGVPQEL